MLPWPLKIAQFPYIGLSCLSPLYAAIGLELRRAYVRACLHAYVCGARARVCAWKRVKRGRGGREEGRGGWWAGKTSRQRVLSWLGSLQERFLAAASEYSPLTAAQAAAVAAKDARPDLARHLPADCRPISMPYPADEKVDSLPLVSPSPLGYYSHTLLLLPAHGVCSNT